MVSDILTLASFMAFLMTKLIPIVSQHAVSVVNGLQTARICKNLGTASFP